MSDVIVLDNGGGFIKAGFAGRLDPSAVVPNCLGRPIASKKWLIADQVFSCEDLTSITLRRPIDRGYLINFDLQKEIWDRIFHQTLQVDPASSPLLLVEPLFNLPSIQRATDEVIFEDFGFKSLYIADSPSLTHMYEVSRHAEGLPAKTQCSLVVDCGFSFTHAAPVLQNFTLKYAVKRIDLGGKALTNYLKELISYRSVNVMDETFIIDDVKEKLCFVSLDVRKDLQIARKLGKDNPIKCTYVLPDGINNTKGFVKDPVEAQRYIDLMEYGLHSQPKTHEDTNLLESREKCEGRTIDLTKNFSLTNERFLVPEMIFHPADLGMNQAGLAECIVRSVNSCHPHLRPVLFESIILTGGSTMFPHFAKRLEMELRPLVPDDYQVKITTQKDPILSVWRGGSLFASTPDFDSMCVTKAEYEELGSARCRRRFFQ